MSTVQDLMGLGLAPALAARLGNTPASLTGVGTAQVGAAAINQHVTYGAAESGQTAYVLPSGASLGSVFYYYNTGAATALVYPPSGNSINAGAGDAAFSVATHKPGMFVRMTSTTWMALTA